MWLDQTWHNLEDGEVPCWSVSWYQPDYVEILIRQDELPNPDQPMALNSTCLVNAPDWLIDKMKEKLGAKSKLSNLSVSPITAFLDD